ncbi:MAG: hypothetical protein ABIO02_00725 [Patescibacteria group bacterium]
MSVEYRPFPGIAHFPATEYELEGKIITVPSEPISSTTPIFETSVLMEETLPDDEAEIVREFMQKEKLRKRYSQDILNPRINRGITHKVEQLLLTYPADTQEDREKRDVYERLQAEVEQAALNTSSLDYLAGFPGLTEPLPESTQRMPQRAIDLANAAFKLAFPKEFGTIIPELTQDIIHVIDDELLQEYMTKSNTTTVRTALNIWMADAYEGLGYKTDTAASSEKPKKYPDFLTFPQEPGKPIIFSSSFINIYPDQVRDECLAAFLIHENLHRANRGRTIPLSNPYYNQGYELNRYLLQPKNDEEEQFMDRKAEDLEKILEDNNGSIVIEGAIIAVKYDDPFINQQALVSPSGYDLNEAITELLAQEVRRSLVRVLLKSGKTFQADIVAKSYTIEKDSAPDPGSPIYHNYSSQIRKMLRQMGLTKPSDILRAFALSKIPALYNEHIDKDGYAT